MRVQRRLAMHQHSSSNSFDDAATIANGVEKNSTDDLSFYDCASPARSCGSGPGSPSSCMMMDMDLFSPQTSPLAATTISNSGLMMPRSLQLQLVDYNSLDSGYISNTGRNVLNAPTLSSSSLSSSTFATSSSALAATESLASLSACFKFAEPIGVAPKTSPPKQQLLSAFSSASAVTSASSPPQSTSCFRPFNSAGTDSVDSMDDDYMDLLDMEAAMDDEAAVHNDNAQQSHNHNSSHNTALPSHFSSIISGTIRTPSPQQQLNSSRAPLRRCLSLIESNTPNVPKTPEQQHYGQYAKAAAMDITPLSAAAMTYQRLTNGNGSTARAFKRPEAPAYSPTLSKRFKVSGGAVEMPSTADKENQQLDCSSSSNSSSSGSNSNTSSSSNGATRHLIRKSMSMTDATSIMSALARSSVEPDLIGDFSKPYVLPLMAGGRHRDLKSISAATMARLLRGDFADRVNSFRVVDCRYPYEFEGGHIAGAENLYTQEEVLRVLVHSQRDRVAQVQPEDEQTGGLGATTTATGTTTKRDIIVFHCEFSSERGPKLSRFLRNHDRQSNTNVYPALHYPEVYLLHGGYKEFYEQNAALCAPVAYRPMLDPAYGAAYKHFRAQTKSWNGTDSTSAGNASTSGSSGGGGGGHRLMKSRSRLVL